MSRNNDGDLILIVVSAFLYVFTKNIFQNKRKSDIMFAE